MNGQHQRRRKQVVTKLAAPIRNLLQSLVRQKIKTAADREKLASFLGLKSTSVSNMLYKGEGGLNQWIAALVYCYDIKIDDITYFFENYSSLEKKVGQMTAAQRDWIALGNRLNDQDKAFIANVVTMARKLYQSHYNYNKKKSF